MPMISRMEAPGMIARYLANTFPVVALAALWLQTGCSSGGTARGPVSISAWQARVQSYVTTQGNGDMNALRDADITPGQPGFRIFTQDRPENSKDVAGVLVGVHMHAQRLWYVYLVGELDKELVTSLRLAAVSLDGAQFDWRVGEDVNGAGEAAYIAHREKQWRASHEGAGEIPRNALGFPSDDDQLSLESSGGSVTVRDASSGAQWSLSLESANAGA